MVNRVLLATTPVLVTNPAIRAALGCSDRWGRSLKFRWLRLCHILSWLSLYAAYIGVMLAGFAFVPILGLLLLVGLIIHLKSTES